MKRIHFSQLIAVLLFVLFVYTALNKYFDMANFRASLEESPWVGNYSIFVSYAVPLLELIVAALLLVPRTRLKGLYASFWLMLFFTIYIAYMLVFTPELPCSCGGVISEMTWPQHLVFNIVFTLLAYVASWLHKHPGHAPQQAHTISYTYK
ncbi:MAG: hypothetical protein H7Y03_01030 [Chitinophagaceae bacterium]|nr:hypothetical protein [Chitinophagaceae bacterium]